MHSPQSGLSARFNPSAEPHTPRLNLSVCRIPIEWRIMRLCSRGRKTGENRTVRTGELGHRMFAFDLNQ